MAASPLTSLATGGPPHLDAVAYTHDTRTRGKPRQEWGGDTFSGTTARSLPTPVTIPPGGIWWRAERDLNQSGGPSDGSSAGSDRARTGADRVDDLGNPVGADPGLRAVGGGSSRGAPLHDRHAARRRSAAHPGNRHRPGRGLVVVLVCRGGFGSVTIPQRGQLHCRYGVRDRFHQPRGGVGHHPGPADGLAVHRRRVRLAVQ